MASLRNSIRLLTLVLLAQACALETNEASVSTEPVAVAVTEQALTASPLTPTADSTIRSGLPFAPDGTGSILGVTSASAADIKRSIIRFSQTQIQNSIPAGNVLHSARLDLKVAGISAGWLGGAIDIMPMNRTWTENNATWVCANDFYTGLVGNLFNNCSSADNWSMLPTGPHPRPFSPAATDRVPIFTGGLTTISFDVTGDVRRFLNGSLVNNGWMLAGAPNLQGGLWVNFGSRSDWPSNRPQLIIEYGPDQCPGNPDKGLPGACGCNTPDLDVNLDNVADCFEAAVTATADTAIRLAIPFGNDGTGLLLPATSTSIIDIERSLIRVSNAAIDAARRNGPIEKAYLELTVAGIAFGWAGGQLAIHRMHPTPFWAEGIGLDGYGASWSCANDANTTLLGNLINDCSPWNDWYMSPVQGSPFPAPYVIPATAVAPVTWPGMTSVRFDVTADVQQFIANPSSNNGWLLQGQASNFLSGDWVNFGARESGAPPRLLLELPTQCTTTFKPSPGVCGCAMPDTDSDSDGTPDCIDECPNHNPQIKRGVCECGEPETDTDGDGLKDCIDPCPLDNDPAAGGECGCPSATLAPAGTECRGACAGAGQSGLDECDGAGHCGAVNNPALCPRPDPTCGACQPYLVQDLSRSTQFTVFWHCPCPRSGDAASAACSSVPGAHLAEIGSAGENAFVRALITSDTWIGANDRSQDGQWRWAWGGGHDGAPFWTGGPNGSGHGLYENWLSGEPGGGVAEACGAMSFASTAGEWQDRGCNQTLNFFCERAIETSDTDDVIVDTDPTCAYLGNDCRENTLPCIDESMLPGGGQPQTVQKDQLDDCNACTRNCPTSNPPTPAELDACELACATCTGVGCVPPCSGSSEPPDPLTSVACSEMDTYPLEPTIFAEPPPEMHCALEVASPFSNLFPCDEHADCVGQPAGTHCGEVFHCRDCDPTQGPCDACVGEIDQAQQPQVPPGLIECTPRVENNKNQNLCLAKKYCGAPIAECFLEDDNPVFCAEYNLCIDPADVHTPPGPVDPAALEIPEIFEPEAEFTVPPVPAPDPFFPEDPACNGGAACTAPKNQSHPWCHYQVTEGLAPQAPSSPDKPVDTGDSILSFNVDPGVSLIYETGVGPLGMPLPYLAAEAHFIANSEINIFNMTKQFDLINLAAGARGGIHDDPIDEAKRVCGFKAYARAEILGMDILPEQVNFQYPDRDQPSDPDPQLECLKAVSDFQTVVDSARKAFADARELVRQYNDLKNKVPAEFFSDGSNQLASLCEQIAMSPPRNFPVWGPCETERPVDTINRFIFYYNTEVIGRVRTAAEGLAQDLDALVAAQGLNGRFEIFEPIHEDEQITLFNSTFFVGPVPCNLEVLLTAQYGVEAFVLADFRIGTLVGNLVLGRPLDDNPPFKVGLDGGPAAGVGLSLFAGVGFDIGFASAKLGIDGAIDLGHASVPVTAFAGLNMGTKPDLRAPPANWADAVDVNAGSLIPTQRLAFSLLYGYGSNLHLNHILSGSLGLSLKIKFFFFSLKYRKALISFTGLCAPEGSGKPRQDWCDIPLFTSMGRDNFGWGEIQLPMPFYPIKYLDWNVTDPVGTANFDDDKVGEVFYDSLCQCIPNWDDNNPPEQDCYRPEDCCGNKTDPTIVCYENPEPFNGVLRSQCAGCRHAGSGSTGDNCNKDSDCCEPAVNSCYKPNPSEPGTCRPKADPCFQGCLRDEDCKDIQDSEGVDLRCGPSHRCVFTADFCGPS